MQDLIKFLNKYNVQFTVEGDKVVADNINLSHNQITHLPESIGNLKCNNLGLSSNQITHLPESIGNLKCNDLGLSFNKIKDIPTVRKFDPIEITDEYIFCDEILTWYKSKKTIDEYDVYKGYHNDYVVSDGEHFAHGDSIRQCISDIHFKKSDRDTSKYKGLSIDTKMNIHEAITMYRIITGACSGGVESFLQTQNIKNEYSINEIIQLTENQFGHQTFKTFFDSSPDKKLTNFYNRIKRWLTT